MPLYGEEKYYCPSMKDQGINNSSWLGNTIQQDD